MPRLVRVAIPCVAAAILLAPPASRGNQPQPGGSFTIERDAWGVPHISSETNDGLFRGQGYAVAEDRLWQLELYSRTAAGTLSEILGGFYLEADQWTRREGYTDAEIDAQLAALRPETRAIFASYAMGVNQRIVEVMADPEALLPYEFWETGATPSYWTDRKVLAVTRYLALTFGITGGRELYMANQLESLGPELFDETYPVNDPTATTTIRQTQPGSAAQVPHARSRVGERSAAERAAGLRRFMDGLGRRISPEAWETQRSEAEMWTRVRDALGLPPKFGSYGVAIAGGRSSSGAALLLGAPQTGTPHEYQAQLGVEVDLHGGDYQVAGMAVPGIPGVVVGRNPDIAWTLTSGITDNVDVFAETLDEDDENYLFDGEWVPIETRTETIRVHRTPTEYTVRRTIHGPVFGLSYRDDMAYTRKRACWGLEGRFAEMVLDLDRAVGLDGAAEALTWNPVSFNAMVATEGGEIGYWHTGLFQDRRDGVDPRLPHNGTGTEEWQGMIPFQDLPSERNPGDGYFANWNNKPRADWDNGDNVPWVGPQHVHYITDYLDGIPAIRFLDLENLPHNLMARGTYEQIVELGGARQAKNILPPGQSGFVNRSGAYDPHFADQFDLYQAWGYKDWTGGSGSTSVGEDATGTLPAHGPLALSISSRPAAGEVRFRFSLDGPATVSACAYDVSGRLVRTLFRGPAAGGEHELRWDGRDDHGAAVPAGVYFVGVAAGGESAVEKVLLAR